DDRVQRMRRAERVPEAEHSVLIFFVTRRRRDAVTRGFVRRTISASPRLPFSASQEMHLPIMSTITSIDIIEDVRLDHRVIERGVEGGGLIIRPAGDFDFRQLFVPCRFCIGADFIEIPSGKLGLEILPRAFDGDVRDRDLYQNLFVRLGGKTYYGLNIR